jgi:hypothetical protein
VTAGNAVLSRPSRELPAISHSKKNRRRACDFAIIFTGPEKPYISLSSARLC